MSMAATTTAFAAASMDTTRSERATGAKTLTAAPPVPSDERPVASRVAIITRWLPAAVSCQAATVSGPSLATEGRLLRVAFSTDSDGATGLPTVPSAAMARATRRSASS